MQDKKQYWIAGLILLVGILISSVILLAAFLPKRQKAPAETTGGTAPVTEVAPEVATDSATEAATEAAKEITVTFYDEKGTLMQKSAVRGGETVLPPTMHSKTQIFKGWSQNLFWIDGDMDVYPLVTQIDAKKNVFYADAVYAKSGGEVRIPVYIGGEVDLGDFTMEISYDAVILRYGGIEGESVTAVDDAADGRLTVKRTDGERLNAAGKLFTLCFTATDREGYESEILLRPKETFTLEKGEKVYVDSIAYDAKLYLLQIK